MEDYHRGAKQFVPRTRLKEFTSESNNTKQMSKLPSGGNNYTGFFFTHFSILASKQIRYPDKGEPGTHHCPKSAAFSSFAIWRQSLKCRKLEISGEEPFRWQRHGSTIITFEAVEENFRLKNWHFSPPLTADRREFKERLTASNASQNQNYPSSLAPRVIKI